MDQLHGGSDSDCRNDIDLLRIVFQGKWRLRVLQEVVKGPVRLSQLRRAMPECSKKVLIDTLHGLEGLGWIERQEFPTKLRKVEYSLTTDCEQDVRRAIAIASNGERQVATSQSRDASDSLVETLSDADEEQIVTEFQRGRHKGKAKGR